MQPQPASTRVSVAGEAKRVMSEARRARRGGVVQKRERGLSWTREGRGKERMEGKGEGMVTVAGKTHCEGARYKWEDRRKNLPFRRRG